MGGMRLTLPVTKHDAFCDTLSRLSNFNELLPVDIFTAATSGRRKRQAEPLSFSTVFCVWRHRQRDVSFFKYILTFR